MQARTIKAWCWVHKWTSLICTVFLLLLCVTGLPLIFYHEIEEALGNSVEAPEMPAHTAKASLDDIVAAGQKQMPDRHVQFMFWDEDHPNLVYLSMALAPDADSKDNEVLVMDERTGQVLDQPNFRDTVMFFIYRLHVDIFAGLPGKLFLGVMGLLFSVAIISGIVIYAPFMRRLDFGTVRRNRSRRVKWLDLHNLLGVVTLTWALVVGFTGVINTWADLVIKAWQVDQLAEMVAPYAGKPPLEKLGSVQKAVETARTAAPDMTPSFVAYPQSAYSSTHHYAVFMHGDTPFTSRLLKPALVDAETGELTDMRDMPWYATALLVSQPLHFGDYGGMALKILWAILDVITIIVLASGLYLWLARRNVSLDARLRTLQQEQASVLAAPPQAAE